MFQNFKLKRNHIIIGICALILIITGASLLRINYNQSIIDSYEALSHPLPERTKLAVFESVWHKYTGFERDRFVTRTSRIYNKKRVQFYGWRGRCFINCCSCFGNSAEYF